MKPTIRPRRRTCSLTRVAARRARAARRGISAFWIIVLVPVLLVALALTLNVANLWLARVELENSLESAALAAVKEWAESGDMSTLVPREIGTDFALANTVRCIPTVIATNWDPNATQDNPNENLLCEIVQADPANNIPPGGNLVFGSLDPFEPGEEVVFDAGIRPQCAGDMVLFDASGQGQGGLEDSIAWGVAFLQDLETPLDLRIDRVVIDLRASGGSGVFQGVFELTQPGDQEAVHDMSGNSQPNIEGFPNPDVQIEFVWDAAEPGILTILFHPDPVSGDTGFNPGDRFRFGAGVLDVSMGSGNDDGDGIGRDGASATVFFDSPVDVPFTGIFLDNTDRSNDCIDPAMVEPITGSLIVNPQLIPDLPCPPSAAANNNGQSFVVVGGGNRHFAVRAQATINVPLLLGANLLALDSYCITVKTTAYYDCQTRRSRLIRIDRFICP